MAKAAAKKPAPTPKAAPPKAAPAKQDDPPIQNLQPGQREPGPESHHVYSIADRLDGIMSARQMSARALERACGISGDGIRNIVRGKSKNPKKATLEVIARGLGVSTAYLMGLPGSRPTDPPDTPVHPSAFPPSPPPTAHYAIAPPPPSSAATTLDPATLRIERILVRLLRSSIASAYAATEHGGADPAGKLAEVRGSLTAAREALEELRSLRPELDQRQG